MLNLAKPPLKITLFFDANHMSSVCLFRVPELSFKGPATFIQWQSRELSLFNRENCSMSDKTIITHAYGPDDGPITTTSLKIESKLNDLLWLVAEWLLRLRLKRSLIWWTDIKALIGVIIFELNEKLEFTQDDLP